MSSRTWTAVLLCFGIWFAYLQWYAPIPVSKPGQGSQQTGTTPAAPTVPGAPSVPVAAPSEIVQSATPTVDYRTSTKNLELAFSDIGGKISLVRTQNYRVSAKKDADLLTLLSPESNPATLGTSFSDPVLSALGTARFTRQNEGGEVLFRAEQGGVTVVKTYQVPASGNFIESTVKLTFPKGAKADWGYLYIPIGAASVQYDHNEPLKSWEAVRFQDQALKRVVTDKLPEVEEIHQGNTGWAAFGNRYFTTAVASTGNINPDVVLTKKPQFVGTLLRYPLLLKEGQTEITLPFKIYVGPKDSTQLTQVPGMKGLIDYGMFTALAYPLLWILQLFHSLVHNYGVAIVLLTIFVRLLFYPLSFKSFKSMKAMQKLQPQIAALKEKHKDDMKRLNEEQMALFKAHKVNPAGGCLPMLVQLPVFIALYAVLGNSIELFQAPFFGWIHDLSTKDPFYIYPVLMGISMFLQQKMTPAVGMDPMQQKIMLFMPVMFSFMMFNLPAGLTMYIFISTLLGILQQWSMRDKPSATTVSATA